MTTTSKKMCNFSAFVQSWTMLIKLDQVFLYILVYKIIYHVINLMILFWHHKYYLHQIAIVTHHGLITKNSESDCTIDQEASKKRRNSDSYHACLIFLFVLFVELNIIVTHYRRPRVRRVPEAHGEDFADGGRRQSADGSYRDGEALVCRVSKVAHTANFFAVCIYRRTAKKSEKTPSGLADGVGVCSPCVCTVDTRWTFRLRRVSLVLAHGKSVSFAVCLAYDARRIMVSSPCARSRHTAN